MLNQCARATQSPTENALSPLTEQSGASPTTDHKIMWLLGAWGSATLLHGTYNTLVFLNHPVSIILALLIVIVGVVLSIRLIKTITPKKQPNPIDAKPRLKDIAQQGNPHAIATLLNRYLKPKGISAQVALEKKCLQVMLTSNQVPSLGLVKVIHQGLIRLEVQSIERVKVYGKQVNDDSPDWHREFELVMSHYSNAWFNRALVLEEMQRLEEAKASYDKVIQYEPNSDVSWYNRGVLLGKLQQYKEALESYNQALKIDPYDSRAWNNPGRVLESLQRHDEAFKSYQKAIQIANIPAAWYNRGRLLERN